MSSISGDSYNNYPNTIDGLTFINVNGNNITGNYLNSITDTTAVNTNITTSIGGVFTVKDVSGNELIKCDNNTSITTFFNPRSSFTPSVASDLVNLSYLSNAYWQLSGSNNINGVFQTSGGGSIWFQNAGGVTFILMSGSGVQIRNALLTGDTNLFTIYNTYGGSNQLLQCDASGNLSNCPNLSYTYGDINSTIVQTVPSNISAQQQTLQWTRDFTVNSLYGWKLTTTTINKTPLDTNLPITINNLYSSAMYPTNCNATNLFINGLNTITEIATNKVKSSSGTLLTMTNNSIEFKIDSDRFKFFDILDIRAFISSPFRIQYNVLNGYAHSFSVNNSQIFSLNNLSGNPSIISSSYFQLSDFFGNKVYTDVNGIYTQGSSGGYCLISGSGNSFLTSSSNSTLALTNSVVLSANAGGNLLLNAGASLYSKTNFTCNLGVNNVNIVSVYDDQHGNDTLFFSKNTNDPNILFGTDITQNNVIGQSSANGAFSSDAVVGDLVIRNNNKNIRLGTNGSGASNFIVNSNGSITLNNRSAQVHQLTLAGNEFYQNGFADTGVSLNCYVNRPGNKQFTIQDPSLAINGSNKLLRMMCAEGSIDCMATDISAYLPLTVLGSQFITNNTTTIKGTASDRLSSLIVDTLRAGISLKSNLTGAANWNFWSGGSFEAFGSAWYLYNETAANFRFTVQAGGDIYLNAYTTNGTLSVTGSNGLISSSSDIRLKENINYITDTKKGLEQILELRPCEFNFIANKEHTQLGLIAQDVEKIIGISVDGKKYEYQGKRDFDNNLMYDEKGEVIYELDEQGNKKIRPRGLDYNAIISTQILAIQELNKRLENQEVLLNHQNQVIQNQNREIAEYKDKVNHLSINQENLTKQIIDITNNLNKITEKIILSN